MEALKVGAEASANFILSSAKFSGIGTPLARPTATTSRIRL